MQKFHTFIVCPIPGIHLTGPTHEIQLVEHATEQDRLAALRGVEVIHLETHADALRIVMDYIRRRREQVMAELDQLTYNLARFDSLYPATVTPRVNPELWAPIEGKPGMYSYCGPADIPIDEKVRARVREQLDALEAAHAKPSCATA